MCACVHMWKGEIPFLRTLRSFTLVIQSNASNFIVFKFCSNYLIVILAFCSRFLNCNVERNKAGTHRQTTAERSEDSETG